MLGSKLNHVSKSAPMSYSICEWMIPYLSLVARWRDSIWPTHDDVIKWKHFPRYWPFVWGIHRSPVNSPHKGQCRGALMPSPICVGINGWVNNREACDLRRHRAHYDGTVMNIPRILVVIEGSKEHRITGFWIISDGSVSVWHLVSFSG